MPILPIKFDKVCFLVFLIQGCRNTLRSAVAPNHFFVSYLKMSAYMFFFGGGGGGGCNQLNYYLSQNLNLQAVNVHITFNSKTRDHTKHFSYYEYFVY